MPFLAQVREKPLLSLRNHPLSLCSYAGPDSDPHGLLYTDHLTASRSIRALGQLSRQPKPWFVATGFVRPHLPFNSPAAFFDQEMVLV